MSPERKGRRTVLPDGEEVRRLRHARGWSQQNLADKAGLQPKTISNVERGKALYADTARRVAHALGVETEDLLLAPGRNESIPEDSPRGGAVGLLPPLPSLVVGRNDAVRALKERLGISRSGDGTLTMRPITVIHGIPGVGKTTVAAVLAYDSQVSAGFPDGVLWASLGEEPDLANELAEWALAVHTEIPVRSTAIKEAKHRLTAVLRDQRILIIVDDVWQVDHAVALQVGGRQSAMVITTREPRVAEALGPTANDVYKLDILPEPHALELLSELAPKVVRQHPAEAKHLVQELECLPLALQVAGRTLRVEANRGWGIGDLLNELMDSAQLLSRNAPASMADLVEQTTPTVAALLQKSTDRLSPDTRERYAYLAAFAPKPATFDLEAMAAVWEVDLPRAKDTASQLIDRGLLEPMGTARFRIHALLVAHAKTLCTE